MDQEGVKLIKIVLIFESAPLMSVMTKLTLKPIYLRIVLLVLIVLLGTAMKVRIRMVRTGANIILIARVIDCVQHMVIVFNASTPWPLN